MAGVSLRKTAGILAGVVSWWLVSCRDIPAPTGGVQSISALTLPSPGLVAGDTLRDSLGLVAPLSVVAYGVDNQPLDPQPPVTFVVLDTGAHLAGGRFLVGDTPGTTVRVVATVEALQTQPASVKVTVRPDTLVPSDSTLHRRRYALSAGDTVIASADLGVLVRHTGITPPIGVEAIIVRYVVAQAPPPATGSGPSVVIVNGNTRSDRDTTDTGGRAGRTARFRIASRTTFTSDTAIINATASYRGATLGTVQFVIIYTNTDSQP